MGRNPVSLDTRYSGEGDGSLLDVVKDPHLSPEEEAVDRSLGEDMEAVLCSLDVRQADVLRLYFGFGGREKLTLEEIGRRYGLTRERIRQIENQALRRLRHPVRRRRLAPHLEK